MKLSASTIAIAIFALVPIASLNAQSSTPRPKLSIASSPAKPSSATTTTAAATPAASAQSAATSAPQRTDVYHVHFTKAAMGKAAQLGDNLKTADPTDPMPGHALVLRHQEGDSWDYAVIQHMGTTASLAASRPAPSPGVRDLSEWHNDTYCNGPSWAEFTKAMGIGESDKKSGAVYVLSVYRPNVGHRDQLEKMLGQGPGPGDTSAGNVLLQHLEGGPWTYLTVARYNSWQDFATNEANAVTDMSKTDSGWFQLREHTSYHTDTVADRIFP